MAEIISGKVVADSIIETIKADVASLKARGIQPGLVVILVGDNPASQTYVNSKHKKSLEIGIVSKVDKVDVSITEDELLEKIANYNNDPTFSGILVQLPLPDHISEESVLNAIDPKKDVDCFHPANVGQLVIGKALAKPCTPAGIIELIRSVKPNTSGMHAVVIGRSNIVGKPIANMLLQPNDVGNCTVTV
ncbi:MAG: bifunctional methylenetetrahydrofolate dehydrogenase/methenyltetrahydrofolate cyclohydrolase, partial [Calditrichaeota bacterium]|nr:bifunctional methylenetetrahydrofolate dehydrogenase/methenyltetrahydrofolate cyclohydrolase [Calditrichota bacterium]